MRLHAKSCGNGLNTAGELGRPEQVCGHAPGVGLAVLPPPGRKHRVGEPVRNTHTPHARAWVPAVEDRALVRDFAANADRRAVDDGHAQPDGEVHRVADEARPSRDLANPVGNERVLPPLHAGPRPLPWE